MIKRQIPLIIAFVMGILFIIQFFVPHKLSQDLMVGVNKWLIIIGAISMLLGIYSLINFHFTNIRRSTAGWGFSIVLLSAFTLALVAGFLPSIVNFVSPLPGPLAKVEQPADTTGPQSLEILFPKGGELLAQEAETNIQWLRKGPVTSVKIEISRNGLDGPWETVANSVDAASGVFTWTVAAPLSAECYARVISLQDNTVMAVSAKPFEIAARIPLLRTTGIDSGSPLFWIFLNALSPFMATMFSLIGFFIASAAFRAFRARSTEATLLLIAAVIIMLGQTPIGQMLWQGIPDIMVWIFSVPNAAAKRAILFGIAMGSIAFSLRIIFGIERAYLGGDQK